MAYWSRLGKETPRGWFGCVRFTRDNTQEGVCWLSIWYNQTREGACLLFGLSSTRYPRRVLSSFGFSLSSTTLQECRVTPCCGGLVKKLTSFAYCLFGVSSLLVCLILGIHRNSWDCLFLFDSNGTTSVVVWLHTGLDTTNPSRVRWIAFRFSQHPRGWLILSRASHKNHKRCVSFVWLSAGNTTQRGCLIHRVTAPT